MKGRTGRRPRTITHQISHGAGSAHPRATTQRRSAAIWLSIDMSRISLSEMSRQRDAWRCRCLRPADLPALHARGLERAPEGSEVLWGDRRQQAAGGLGIVSEDDTLRRHVRTELHGWRHEAAVVRGAARLDA